MRILMSLFRIALGVSIGVGYFAGMAYLPRPFSSLLFCGLYWPLAGAFFYKSIHSLRTGRIFVNTRIRVLVYERASIEYWFYIVLFAMIGFLTVWMSLCALCPAIFQLR